MADINIDPLEYGQFFTFGCYPRTAGGDPEPLVWMPIKIEGKNVLAVTRFVIDVMPYATARDWEQELDQIDWDADDAQERFDAISGLITKGTCWENSDLRTWLNGAFLEQAFLDDEREHILDTPIDGGRDRVFCLSLEETNELFSHSCNVHAGPTGLASEKGVATCTSPIDDEGNIWAVLNLPETHAAWWLRSVTCGEPDISFDGSGKWHCEAEATNVGVRPAIWLRL